MKTELEALESIYYYIVATGAEDDYKKYYERIKSFIKDAKKYKKYKNALEIIKEKGLHYLEISMLKSNLSYEDYLTEMNITIGVRPMIDSKIKTKEEYELLKEILGNE